MGSMEKARLESKCNTKEAKKVVSILCMCVCLYHDRHHGIEHSVVDSAIYLVSMNLEKHGQLLRICTSHLSNVFFLNDLLTKCSVFSAFQIFNYAFPNQTLTCFTSWSQPQQVIDPQYQNSCIYTIMYWS